MTHIKEITKRVYDQAIKGGVATEINWFAIVDYQFGPTKYFVFDEPYNVKVSDFFDMTNKDNPVTKIVMH